jgi:Beta-ketoacyl synthase, N-terminal domain
VKRNKSKMTSSRRRKYTTRFLVLLLICVIDSSIRPPVGSIYFSCPRVDRSKFLSEPGELSPIFSSLLLTERSSATALQSIEIACDSILSGKAKVMIAGGFDDLSEEGSYEFANMKATSNSETEFAMGREPSEMSRPATTTRAGVGSFTSVELN